MPVITWLSLSLDPLPGASWGTDLHTRRVHTMRVYTHVGISVFVRVDNHELMAILLFSLHGPPFPNSGTWPALSSRRFRIRSVLPCVTIRHLCLLTLRGF